MLQKYIQMLCLTQILIWSNLLCAQTLVANQKIYPPSYLQDMVNATTVGGKLYLPAGIYQVNQLILDRPITIEGDGWGAVLQMVGKDGYAIKIVRGLERNEEGQNHDISLRNIRLDGGDRIWPVGAVSIANLDHATFENMTLENFQGSAFSIEKSLRESVFRNIHIRYCGTQNAASINIGQEGLGDATNNIYLSEIFIAYSFGTDIFIGNTKNSGGSVRRIFADHVFLHGLLPAVKGRKYSWSENEIKSVRLRIGDVFDFRLRDSTINVAGIGMPAILVGADEMQREGARKRGLDSPSNIVLSDITVGARYQLIAGQGLDMPEGGALTVLTGEKIYLSGFFAMWQGAKKTIVVAPGATVYQQPTNLFTN
jgi:hypothetical protein